MAKNEQNAGYALISPNKRWQEVDACPCCGNVRGKSMGFLPGGSYLFGNELIAHPHGGVEISACSACGLVYKKTIPTPEYLSEVFISQAGNIWSDDYNYVPEKTRVLSLTGGREFDLLDIGPSRGNFLKALGDAPGRRSGLDIVRHPGVEKWLRGEFIDGLMDDESFSWSGDAYNVVTAFDVLEHLYAPAEAFKNLRNYVLGGGYVVIETGDVASYWPKSYGVNNWWYVNLFEHHVFWSRTSLEFIAARYGFEIVSLVNKRHKQKVTLAKRLLVKNTLKTIAYKLKHIVRLNKDTLATQPVSPYARDHMLVVLKRN